MIRITRTNHIEEENEDIVRDPEEQQETETEKINEHISPDIILTDLYLNNANDLTNAQLQLKEVVDKIRAIDDEDTDYGRGCLNFSCPNQRKSNLFDSLIDAVKKNERSLMLENEALKAQVIGNLTEDSLRKIGQKIEENKKIKELHSRIKIYDDGNKHLRQTNRKLKGMISTLEQKARFKDLWERDKEYKTIVSKIRERHEHLKKVSDEVYKKKSDVKAMNVHITKLKEEIRIIESARNQILEDTKTAGQRLEELNNECAKIEARVTLLSVKIPGLRKPAKRTVAVARQPSIIDKGKQKLKQWGEKYRHKGHN